MECKKNISLFTQAINSEEVAWELKFEIFIGFAERRKDILYVISLL